MQRECGEYETRLKAQLGDAYAAYEAAMREKPFAGLRVNTMKLAPEELQRRAPFSLRRVPWTKNGFYYADEMQPPSKHPYYAAGLYYLQEPSAMAPASLLPVRPGERVLDLCAAPGGKSTALAEKLSGRGLLVANDISQSRAKALLKNLELFGVRNALVTSEAPRRLATYFPMFFDKILVDAPCSGEGMFRKQPSVRNNWEQYGTEYYARMQREILTDAVGMLRPGGLLLYSTCTFSPEEDEGALQFIMEQCPELCLVPLLSSQEAERLCFSPAGGYAADGTAWPESFSYAMRLWPHRIEGEGHFVALLQRGAEGGLDDAAGGCGAAMSGLDGIAGGCEAAVSGYDGAAGECEAAMSGYDGAAGECEAAVSGYDGAAGEKEAAVSGYDGTAGKKEAAVSGLESVSRARASSRGVQRRGASVHTGRRETLQLSEEARAFLSLITPALAEERLFLREERLYLLPESMPEVRGLRLLRTGLLLGEMKKNRFVPSQALACALSVAEYKNVLRLPVTGEAVTRYLKCETFEPQTAEAEACAEGWVLVCVEEFPLGWAKKTKGGWKNKYLAGWRQMV